jgi:hypothetical protein
MRLALRFAHGLMAALFIFAAALQYNDVDVWRWVAIYLAAAVVAILGAMNRPKAWLAGTVALIAVAWASIYFYQGAYKVPLAALWSEWEMKDQTVVAGREMDGLFIVFFWMVVSWFTARQATKSAASTQA